jgi:O-acetyl-ADP-ribose deacetylase (regulator of RNase III)
MLELKQGNLLDEKVEALVNTVNCVGVMGKGIALQFKQAYPEVFKQYKKACDAKAVQPGQMFTVELSPLFKPKYIINFPTKRHWRGKSKIEDIESGLVALVDEVKRLEIQSIALPPLGCGNGGLDWSVIKPLIEDAVEAIPDVHVVLFEPGGAPAADKIKVGTQKPKMTRGRALLVMLFELYGLPGYRLGRLEAQKLAYLLQAAGEPMDLRYVKHQFGPYADNLNHALQRMDGHYLKGYGDRQQKSQIYVLPNVREDAEQFLGNDPDATARLDRVSHLIEGFETPYGMEMLATIHWIVHHDAPKAATDVEVAIQKVQEWSDRKARIFKPNHLRKAWQRLQAQGWLAV